MEGKSWSEAKANCVAMGARLMEVRNQAEFELSQVMVYEVNARFWLGASDIESEGEWIWESDNEAVRLDRYWKSGEPGGLPSNYDCLLRASQGFEDFNCGSRFVYFCKFN